MSKIYFVMPAYNEAENIAETVRQWYSVVEKAGKDCRLVIANDGSKDDTFSILQSLKDSYPQLIPLDKPNSGHGATLMYLYRYALAEGADYVFQTDSDGHTIPEEFWIMYDHMDSYDFQIGHRVSREDGFSRVVVTKVLRLIVWLMFHEWVIDANTPFRLMRADKLKAVMDVIPHDYFLCNVAISAIAVKWHYNIAWYSITFRPRQGGANSINLKRIVKIGMKALKDFRKINNSLKG